MNSHFSLLFLLCVAIFLSTSLSFQQEQKEETNSNISLYGDAHYLPTSALSLTQPHPHQQQNPNCSSSPTTSTSVGRAFYAYPIRFLDPLNNATASFSCKFSFSILSLTPCSVSSSSTSDSDGLAFLITTSTDSRNPLKGFMGLPGPSLLNDQESFVAVEFDTSFDNSLSDLNNNHVGIDVNSLVSFASVDVSSRGINLKSGRTIRAWIEYTDPVKLVQVWMSYSTIRPLSPILSARVDLSGRFKEYMHVGFSASNQQGSSTHVVDHWRFRTYGSLPSGPPVDTTEESECIMCFSDQNFESARPMNVQHKKIKFRNIVFGFWGLVAFAGLLIGVLAIFVLYMVKQKMGTRRIVNEGANQSRGSDGLPVRFSSNAIKSATLGFHWNRLIGEGASATVYKGNLPSVGVVAVKRFNKEGTNYARNPFVNELATMMGCLRHKNLIQLIGWCCEAEELALVYEYMENGSLDQVLHGKRGLRSSVLLSWDQRGNVVRGVAEALTYLHEECEKQIIHRDVKACNIMLDAEFNAKLGDFGLAEVYERTSNSSSSVVRDATIPAGTIGYLAPEYVYSGIPTVFADVYSFGVVVLEIATGRRPVDDDGIVLVDLVWKHWEQERLIGVVDPRLELDLGLGSVSVAEVERLLITGLACTHPNQKNRPTVKKAVQIFTGETPIPVLPRRKPKVGFLSSLSGVSLHLEGNGSPGTDDLPWMTPRSHLALESGAW